MAKLRSIRIRYTALMLKILVYSLLMVSLVQSIISNDPGCYSTFLPSTSCGGYDLCGYTCVGQYCGYAGSICLCDCSICATYFPLSCFDTSTALCVPCPTIELSSPPTVVPSISIEPSVSIAPSAPTLIPSSLPTVSTVAPTAKNSLLTSATWYQSSIIGLGSSCDLVCLSYGHTCYEPAFSAVTTPSDFLIIHALAGYPCTQYTTQTIINGGLTSPERLSTLCYIGNGKATCGASNSRSYRLCPCRRPPTYTPTQSIIPTRPTLGPTLGPSRPTVLPSIIPTTPTRGPSYPTFTWFFTNDTMISCLSYCLAQSSICVGGAFSLILTQTDMLGVAASAGFTCPAMAFGGPGNHNNPEFQSGVCYIGGGTGSCGSVDGSGGLRFCPCRLLAPSIVPTVHPTNPSSSPSLKPSRQPLSRPTQQPSSLPSLQPSLTPSQQPLMRPTVYPSTSPSSKPSNQPNSQPTSAPLVKPSSQPSDSPTAQPSRQPLSKPSQQPFSRPSQSPQSNPSQQPLARPSTQPQAQPSTQPLSRPSFHPSLLPSAIPSLQPLALPTSQPLLTPSARPSHCPSSQPSGSPVSQPSSQPSDIPSLQPLVSPSATPSEQPTTHPSLRPVSQPSSAPTALCSVGRYFNPRQLSDNRPALCLPCEVGRYSSLSQATTCASCPSGTYSTAAGISFPCTPCPIGRFSNATGASDPLTCLSCPMGRYSTTAGANSAHICRVCNSGSYSSITGATTCSPCGIGSASNVTGASSSSACLSCAPGQFSSSVGLRNCTPCVAGAFSSMSGSSVCSSCSPGRFVGTLGSLACTPCAAGAVSAQSGMSTCTICQPGEFARSGASACSLCPSGTYSASRGLSFCSLCPAGRSSNAGATSASECINPSMNLALGAIACLGSFYISAVYLVRGDVFIVAVARQRRLTARVMALYTAIRLNAIAAVDSLFSLQENTSAKTVHRSRKRFRALFYLLLILPLMFVSVGFLLLGALSQIFFQGLLMNRSFPVASPQSIVDFIQQWLLTLSAYFPFLSYFVDPIVKLFQFLRYFHLDLSSLTLDCVGGQAPVTLLFDIIILIIVVICIEADYILLFSSVLIKASEEYIKYILLLPTKSCKTILQTICAVFLYVTSHLNLMEKLLQFAMATLSFDVLFNVNTSFISNNASCDSVTYGVDSIVGLLAVVVAFLLIIPVLYFFGKIIRPGRMFYAQENQAQLSAYFDLATRQSRAGRWLRRFAEPCVAIDFLMMKYLHALGRYLLERDISDYYPPLTYSDVLDDYDEDVRDAFLKRGDLPLSWLLHQTWLYNRASGKIVGQVMKGIGIDDEHLATYHRAMAEYVSIGQFFAGIASNLFHFTTASFGYWSEVTFAKFDVDAKVFAIFEGDHMKDGEVLSVMLKSRALLFQTFGVLTPISLFMQQMAKTPFYCVPDRFAHIKENWSDEVDDNDPMLYSTFLKAPMRFLNTSWAYRYFSNLFIFVVGLMTAFAAQQYWSAIIVIGLVGLAPMALAASLVVAAYFGRLVMQVTDNDFRALVGDRLFNRILLHGNSSNRRFSVRAHRVSVVVPANSDQPGHLHWVGADDADLIDEDDLLEDDAFDAAKIKQRNYRNRALNSDSDSDVDVDFDFEADATLGAEGDNHSESYSINHSQGDEVTDGNQIIVNSSDESFPRLKSQREKSLGLLDDMSSDVSDTSLAHDDYNMDKNGDGDSDGDSDGNGDGDGDGDCDGSDVSDGSLMQKKMQLRSAMIKRATAIEDDDDSDIDW